ncbi:MAG: hypothetical protein FWH52_06030, partial [Synergistaceae bacterium]|nr:hypothetical protein [Synergistaceae bacterium]
MQKHLKGNVTGMDNKLKTPLDSGDSTHFVRKRLNRLLEEAIKCPLVIVCAGAGFGKTRAVYDFLVQLNIPVAWEQMSERDNVASRTWESLANTFAQMDPQLGDDIKGFGFPDTEEKRKQIYRLYERSMLNQQQYIFVMDDFHFIKDKLVFDYVEHSIYYMPSNRKTMIIISREPPSLNLAGLRVRGLVAQINEEDLSFTESELGEYLSHQGLTPEKQTLSEIFQDTNGWAFAVNLVVQSLKKSPLYSINVRNAIKKNFFELIESEVFNVVSGQLRHFLLCLSLIDHLSVNLVNTLAGEEKSLLVELERLSSFIRYDSYVKAYMIHHLFLDFLRANQHILTEEEKRRIYKTAADWCNENGFKIDAMSYYERIGDFNSIMSIFFDFPLQIPSDIALFAEQLFDRAPPDIYIGVRSFAAIHTRVVISLGKWQKALKLLADYEKKLLVLPGDPSLNYTLVGLYYAWGMVRQLVSTMDDCYDFDVYYARMNEYMSKTNVEPNKLTSHSIVPWISLVGSARAGAPQEYIDALYRAEEYASRCYNGRMAGSYDLARGELKFYQGDVRAAERLIVKGLEGARASGQFTQVHRALFYMLRIAVSQGNFAKAEQALKDTEALQNVTAYTASFFAYDITLGAFYCYILEPERVPGWLKGKFSTYGHPVFKENSANQIKLQYCYITDNYASLLSYMEEQKRWETVLFGRVEIQAMEACVLFKTKDRAGAFDALREAYETAFPNNILMPFICLGKDMQTLASEALNDNDCTIPKPWLEMIIRKSTSYARRHRQFISNYRKAKALDGEIILSSSESEVLRA